MDNDAAGRLFTSIITFTLGIIVFLIFLIFKLSGMWSDVNWLLISLPLIIGLGLGFIINTISITITLIKDRKE